MNPKVDFYFKKAGQWQEAILELRTLALHCKLSEELKWGVPCYTSDGANIVLIHVFKDYCALLFFKGVLLSDDQGILVQQTEHVQAARQMRFKNIAEVKALKPVITRYIAEAVSLERSGAKVALKATAQFEVPQEWKAVLQADPVVKAAFDALTPGRQRGYLLYFAAPRQSKTKEARIQKSIPHILDGKGLDD